MKKKPSKSARSRKSQTVEKFPVRGKFDENGIYRLEIPMEAYDIICHYKKISGKLAEFIDYVVPMLSGDAYSLKSILKIVGAARENPKSADDVVKWFVMELRHFQMHLERGFSRIDWIQEGERMASKKIVRR